MANIASLFTGLSGMTTQRHVMDIVGHNVANEATPGYHRQRAELRSLSGSPVNALFAGRGRTYGVDVLRTTRAVDDLLASRATREQSSGAAATLMATTMRRLEGLFPEPSDVGLAHQLDEFWGGWTGVANQPGGLAARTQLLERAETLVASLRRTAADVTAARDSAIARTASLATEANDLAGEIATLNSTIVANPSAALDLIDRRDLLVTSLAELTGAVARPQGNGQVDVYIGGRAVVTGKEAHALDGAGGTLRWAIDNQLVDVSSGEAATLAITINDVVPRYLGQLDAVAATLVSQVNAVHTQGYDQNGVTGRNFFDPAGTTAATIALSADVAGLEANIAAGAPVLPGPTAPGPLDGEQARALAALADDAAGADVAYRAMIAGLAVETRAATRRADIQEQVADAAKRDADSVGAVSIDEEMAALVQAQRAYEASARFLTTVDELLGVLIERTGVVGR